MSGPVLILAGGTGGHIFPGLALAEALKLRRVPVLWLGSRHGLEARLVPERGLAFVGLKVRALRGKGWLGWLWAPVMLFGAVLEALSVVWRSRPRAVVSFGGFAAGPGGVAAWLLGRPLLVHEQNRIAGWTNRILARLARANLSGFPEALPRARHVGNPVRIEIAALMPPERRLAGRVGSPRLLVLGGSQGARALNEQVPRALARLRPEARYQVRHQCGPRWLEATRAAYAAAGVEASVEAFIDDMVAAYDWADLVLCRAGALTLAELACAGLPAVLVPFPYAVDDHQTANARVHVAAGAAELLPEAELDPERLAALLERLARDPAARIGMAVAARGLAKPNAAEELAELCLELARP